MVEITVAVIGGLSLVISSCIGIWAGRQARSARQNTEPNGRGTIVKMTEQLTDSVEALAEASESQLRLMRQVDRRLEKVENEHLANVAFRAAMTAASAAVEEELQRHNERLGKLERPA